MREFKALDKKTGKWYFDGDIFSNGWDSKRKYACKVTNHGILYTKTHVDTKDSIVQGIDGREGYTDWDYETLYTDVILCQFTGLTDKNGTKIFEGDEVKGKFNNSEKEGFIMFSVKLASFRIYKDGWTDAVTEFNSIESTGNNIHDNDNT